MTKIVITTICILLASHVCAQSDLTFTPMIQQSGINYSSERVTAYGYGFGLGCGIKWKRHVVAQADLNLLWGNGNAIASRLAGGYQRTGKWAPAVYLTSTFIAGDKTEALDDEGQRPPAVAWAAGLRITPLRFEGNRGFISALELGYGLGADRGQCLEATLLSVGIRF